MLRNLFVQSVIDSSNDMAVCTYRQKSFTPTDTYGSDNDSHKENKCRSDLAITQGHARTILFIVNTLCYPATWTLHIIELKQYYKDILSV